MNIPKVFFVRKAFRYHFPKSNFKMWQFLKSDHYVRWCVNLTVLIISQSVYTSNHHIIHSKHTQFYVSIISQAGEGEKNFFSSPSRYRKKKKKDNVKIKRTFFHGVDLCFSNLRDLVTVSSQSEVQLWWPWLCISNKLPGDTMDCAGLAKR